MASGSILQDPSCQAQQNQSITLADGRKLGFAEFGSISDDATPLFYLHGLPGSRLDAALFHPAACEVNVRVMGIDRPGFGLSSSQSNRKLLDSPADVRELAKYLKLEQYYVFGFSGGGLYALACAYALPKTELLGVGVASGMGPWSLGTYGMKVENRVLFNCICYTPWLARRLVGLGFAEFIKGTDMVKMKEVLMKNLVPADQEFCQVPEIENIFPLSVAEAFKQGADAMMEDGRIVTSDWGFEPKDIPAKNTRLWYGTADVNVPVTMGRYLEEQIPHATLKEYEGDTHFMIMGHVIDFLKDLVAPAST
ncbi:uncharacterized protein N7483_001887 [Penicillium malachiteum]|uniref:uncharacterized protein n=1 Tax=Penicillium malachiteum TaxID=1324776 RepID=UPI002548D453|nr:uncharacterized protein N7483_001887 [Penicillium malachiteum]KAJ5736762.1 hypothetical protein N7483_001887 [Penicillium malachiteum]